MRTSARWEETLYAYPQIGESHGKSYGSGETRWCVSSEDVPSFPPDSVVAKALDLGFGSGPWDRAELSARWSESSANKFISDAKSFGWLISPFQNEFYVPPARDLSVVGWLPGFERQEFIVSRTLAALGVRYWCLSAWARARGLVFPQPLFVTDLGSLPTGIPTPPPEVTPPPESRLKQAVGRRASSWGRLPYLDSLIIVPEVPQTSRFARPTRTVLTRGFPQKTGVKTWILEEDWKDAPDPEVGVRAIQYPLSPDVDDVAWVVALLFSLGLPRIDEVLEETLREALVEEPRLKDRLRRRQKKPPAPLGRRIEQWAGLLSPPRPNDAWRELVAPGPPYLLVPPELAADIATGAWARRFADLRGIREWLDAKP